MGTEAMDGKTFKAIRESHGATQESWAVQINSRSGKRHDKSRISRWESGSEPIPVELANTLLLDNMKYTSKDHATIVSTSLRKGGSGKTTITAYLGYVLSRVRIDDRTTCRILVIDADSQGNLSHACGISKEQIADMDTAGRSFYHVLTGKCKAADAVIPTSVDGMHIMPSSVSTAFAERELLFREALEGIPANNALKDALTPEFTSGFDFILIDCAPTLGVTTLCPLVVSDYVLFAVQAEPYALTAMDHLAEIIGTIRKTANPELRVLGVVPNMVTVRFEQDKLSMVEMAEKAAMIRRDMQSVGVPVFTAIPRSTNFARAAASNVILYQYDPAAPGIETFVEVAAALGVRTYLGD